MTKLLPFAVALLLMAQLAAAQQTNPLIVSGDLLREGERLADSGQYKKALPVFRKIDRNDTNYVKALYDISNCYYEDSQFNASLEYTLQALALHSDPDMEPQLLNHYGNIYNEWDSSEKAIRIYDSAIRKYPAYSLFYLNKGSALIKLKRFAEAEAVFKECLLINPYSYNSHYKLGYCAIKQGKVIPALFSFIGYLLVQPEGNFRPNSITFLNGIARNLDSIQAYVSRRTEEPDENYQLLERIVQSGIALDKSYVPLLKLDDPISRQIQVVFEKMQYQEADNDFWMQYYVPWLKSVYASNRFEVFINRIFLGVNIPIIQDYVKKHKTELDQLKSDLVDYLDKIINTRELNYVKRQVDSVLWSRSDGQLTGHGIYLDKAEKRLGDWTFYYGQGNLKGKGSYNSDGKREGPFTWYNFDGQVQGKEFYRNGRQEGEEWYYFSNGEPYTHSRYKNDSLDGESASFYYVGTPKVLAHYRAGQLDGEKIYFRSGGDTSEIEHYSKGKLNGSDRSLSKYGTTETVVNYRNDEREGIYQKFYPNGKLSVQGEYKAGKQQGVWKWWHPNGQLKLVTSFIDDVNDGKREEFYENGVLASTYLVKSGKVTGDEKFYDEDAKLYSVFHYDNKSMQKAQYFDKSGKLISESTRDDGKKMISMVQYLADGSKHAEVTYDDKENIVGTLRTFYKSGKLYSTEPYVAGQLEGLSSTFYANGNKRSETMYAAGKMDGYHRSWFSHGQLQEEGWYSQGNREGYWIDYDELGKVTDSAYYKDDDLDGYKSTYAPDGRKLFEYKFKTGWVIEYIQYDTTGKVLSRFLSPNGTGKFRTVYPNGQPRVEAEYLRSKLVGPDHHWFFDGKPLEFTYYTRGQLDSSYRLWFHNGRISIEGQYAFGEKTGSWKDYNPDGSLRETESYVRGELEGVQTDYFENGKVETLTPFEAGQKEGISKEYDPDGTLVYQMTYHDGVPVAYSYLDSKDSLLPATPIQLGSGKVKTFFPNGKPSAEFEYNDGSFDGDRRFYYTNGQLRSMLHWDRGIAEGPFIQYYPNGRKKTTGNYVHDNLQGPFQRYNEKGLLKEEWNYYNGVPNGVTRLFDDNGRLTETDYYYYGLLLSVK